MSDNYYIRDHLGQIIGRIDGKYIRAQNGSILGRYDASTNYTRDKLGKFVGKGDQRMRFLGGK